MTNLSTIMKRSATTDLGTLLQKKEDLVADSSGTKSLRDFGGLYLVYGRYLLNPAVRLQADFASMVDGTPRAEFDVAIQKAKEQNPKLDVEFVNADFRFPETYKRLRPVDTSILFEVLLHQENYVGVCMQVAEVTTKYICIAQPCLKETEVSLPSSAVLLQFWPEELKDKFREGTMWPKEPRTERFAASYWMWGHTTSHLVDCMQGLGWKLEAGEEVADIYGPHWDYVLMRFSRLD